MTDMQKVQKTKKYIRELYDESLRIESEMADIYIELRKLFPDEGHNILPRQDIKILKTLIGKYEFLLDRKECLISTADLLRTRIFTSKEFNE